MYDDITLIICCAGMGTRLGIGTTKTLISVGGEPLIKRQLAMMNEVEDVRIVVGFQAERVIECVNSVRKDIMFAFNYEYQTTGEAESLSKALIGLKEYCVIIDGDLLLNELDFKSFLKYTGECVGICNLNSDEPIFATLHNENVIELNEVSGTHEYSCVAKIKSNKLKQSKGSVYELIHKYLPMKYVKLRTRDIDTPDDYERMIEWFNTGCND